MGKIKKIIGAFVHAPDRFDALAERIADVSQLMDERIEDVNERVASLDEQTDGLRLRMEEAESRISSQWDDETYLSFAHQVIRSGRGSLKELYRQVDLAVENLQ